MDLRIVVADDHHVVREGIRTILEARSGWEICGEASTGQEAVRLTLALKPDIVIMDLTMPELSGIEATAQITAMDPTVKVLIFSMHNPSLLPDSVRLSGARGYVVKNRAARDLIQAIECLAAGRTFFEPGFTYSAGPHGAAGGNGGPVTMFFRQPAE